MNIIICNTTASLIFREISSHYTTINKGEWYNKQGSPFYHIDMIFMDKNTNKTYTINNRACNIRGIIYHCWENNIEEYDCTEVERHEYQKTVVEYIIKED